MENRTGSSLLWLVIAFSGVASETLRAECSDTNCKPSVSIDDSALPSANTDADPQQKPLILSSSDHNLLRPIPLAETPQARIQVKNTGSTLLHGFNITATTATWLGEPLDSSMGISSFVQIDPNSSCYKPVNAGATCDFLLTRTTKPLSLLQKKDLHVTYQIGQNKASADYLTVKLMDLRHGMLFKPYHHDTQAHQIIGELRQAITVPHNDHNLWYFCTSRGVFRSSDGGITGIHLTNHVRPGNGQVSYTDQNINQPTQNQDRQKIASKSQQDLQLDSNIIPCRALHVTPRSVNAKSTEGDVSLWMISDQAAITPNYQATLPELLWESLDRGNSWHYSATLPISIDNFRTFTNRRHFLEHVNLAPTTNVSSLDILLRGNYMVTYPLSGATRNTFIDWRRHESQSPNNQYPQQTPSPVFLNVLSAKDKNNNTQIWLGTSKGLLSLNASQLAQNASQTSPLNLSSHSLHASPGSVACQEHNLGAIYGLESITDNQGNPKILAGVGKYIPPAVGQHDGVNPGNDANVGIYLIDPDTKECQRAGFDGNVFDLFSIKDLCNQRIIWLGGTDSYGHFAYHRTIPNNKSCSQSLQDTVIKSLSPLVDNDGGVDLWGYAHKNNREDDCSCSDPLKNHLLRSIDGGTTWTVKNKLFLPRIRPNTDHEQYQIDPNTFLFPVITNKLDGGIELWMRNRNGLMVSSDRGTNWEDANYNLGDKNIIGLATLPSFSGNDDPIIWAITCNTTRQENNPLPFNIFQLDRTTEKSPRWQPVNTSIDVDTVEQSNGLCTYYPPSFAATYENEKPVLLSLHNNKLYALREGKWYQVSGDLSSLAGPFSGVQILLTSLNLDTFTRQIVLGSQYPQNFYFYDETLDTNVASTGNPFKQNGDLLLVKYSANNDESNAGLQSKIINVERSDYSMHDHFSPYYATAISLPSDLTSTDTSSNEIWYPYAATDDMEKMYVSPIDYGSS